MSTDFDYKGGRRVMYILQYMEHPQQHQIKISISVAAVYSTYSHPSIHPTTHRRLLALPPHPWHPYSSSASFSSDLNWLSPRLTSSNNSNTPGPLNPTQKIVFVISANWYETRHDTTRPQWLRQWRLATTNTCTNGHRPCCCCLFLLCFYDLRLRHTTTDQCQPVDYAYYLLLCCCFCYLQFVQNIQIY